MTLFRWSGASTSLANAKTQLAEKNSDFIREKADLVARHQKDGTVIKDL
jgi:hypothetical protein